MARSADVRGDMSPKEKHALTVRSHAPRLTAWCEYDRDGSRVLKLPEFMSTSLEMALEGSEQPSPKKRRWLKSRQPKNTPTTYEPYDLEWALEQPPMRHYWRWRQDGVPVPLPHEAYWQSDQYDQVRKFVLETGMDSFVPNPANHFKGCLCCRREGPNEVYLRLEAAFYLPEDWSSLVALMPLRSHTDLDSLLRRCPPASAKKVDRVMGGNLMYHAARAGDFLVCSSLVDQFLGHLAAEIANDGRTSYEIALERGYPDIALLLLPYAAIRQVNKQRKLYVRLRDELQYVVEQTGDVPPRQASLSLLRRIKAACSAPLVWLGQRQSSSRCEEASRDPEAAGMATPKLAHHGHGHHHRKPHRRAPAKKLTPNLPPSPTTPNTVIFSKCTTCCIRCG